MVHELDEEWSAKRRALEEFYGGEVPDSTVERVVMLDADDLVHPFVD
ncbi:hypothetical protein J2Y69_003084 [Microbacterium resistens]|uniref:Uncharacterized protein n=1 Tax=Microbacterium resistens TaxID=156977 RepID=A0ABU1SFU5_9MICO|nr:hypothetical protein [Microbacterium resistens]MDR6868468.1 hypothetical protein [Microbacterium resistens]